MRKGRVGEEKSRSENQRTVLLPVRSGPSLLILRPFMSLILFATLLIIHSTRDEGTEGRRTGEKEERVGRVNE